MRGEGDGVVAALLREREGASDGVADGAFGGTPKEVDAGDVDDGFEREGAGAGFDGAAEGDHRQAGEFAERGEAAAAFDGAGDALGEEEPPGDEVAVPGVDDDVDGLVEEVAGEDLEVHRSVAFRRRFGCPAVTLHRRGAPPCTEVFSRSS